MAGLDEFADILKRNEPLAPYLYLKLGGPAEMLAQPRSREELSRFVRACYQGRIPLRVLGSGCNMVVRDEGVQGVVLRLSEPAFTQIIVEGNRVRAGTGTAVSALISQAARHGLAGFETLVGIPGSVGGALRCNAGDRYGDIGQFVRQVEVMDSSGAIQVRDRDELRFSDHASNLDDPVILSAEFKLESDSADAIVKRMRKAWIARKAAQPLSFQAAARIFKNPRGLSAAALIEQTGLARTRVGGAEVSDRDANYFIVHPGASSRDVLRLIDLVRSRVQERFNMTLEQEITVW
ncbi:MAG TPA: UDP-N-acetylmuramate dehydrogenase [Gemmataceae bacterium]|nr:UDP-N-acetylmuramate dehydrogenase [Gemmataceae bacterium]